MLALRLTVARLGRPMPAFDLALRRWWEANHPGQTLDEYLHGSRFLGRLSDSMSLSAQMESALADLAQAFLLPGTVGNVVGRGLRTIVRALREHRQQVRALARCRRLPDLLEAEPDLETLSYYAHLLAWDLAQLPAEQAALPVVLLDTFEDVGSRAHRELERLIQRVVWLMPNALFVITGRNRLQWDEGRLEGQLDWTGPRAWPFLVPGATQDPRQHRVGYLSAQDCDEYLCRRLTQDGEPLMGHSTRQQVISHSRGLPLYLDLAVMRFLDLYQQRDRHPSPEEFNLDFPALVARTFRDLSSEERQLLRGVSLLDSFSVELATAVAGYDRDTPALHLVERPFIDQDPSAPWPYHLHDLLRDAIRDTDADSEDRWSAADWRRAAQRAFDALGRELARAEPCGDRKVLMACLRQGLRLARDFRLDPDWLTAAAFSYIEDSVWEPIDLDFNPTRIGSPPKPWPSSCTPLPAVNMSTGSEPPRFWRQLSSRACFPRLRTSSPGITWRSALAISGTWTHRPPGCGMSSKPTPGWPGGPPVGWLISADASAGFPTYWTPPTAWVPMGENREYWATCGGLRATSPPPAPPMPQAVTRPRSSGSMVKRPLARHAWHSPLPSRIGNELRSRSTERGRCSVKQTSAGQPCR